MEFQELVRQRYSVRAYKPEAVDRAKLDRVLEAAILAPTAANRQPFRLLVIKTEGRAQELRRIYRAEWFAQAPVVICACGVSEEGWTRSDGKDYTDVDVAIVMDHLILAAANEGLGTCWIGAFDAAAAREVLGLPEGVEPIAFTPLGYPADSLRPKRRRPAEELVKYDSW
jgi:nitroreductase